MVPPPPSQEKNKHMNPTITDWYPPSAPYKPDSCTLAVWRGEWLLTIGHTGGTGHTSGQRGPGGHRVTPLAQHGVTLGALKKQQQPALELRELGVGVGWGAKP